MKYLMCFIRNVNLITTWIINNSLITMLIGVSIADGYSDSTVGDELKQHAQFLESRHVRSTNNHTRLPAANCLR